MKSQPKLAPIVVMCSLNANGGWGGIRTPETLARLPVFKTGAFNHSATHPSPTLMPENEQQVNP